LHLTPLKNFSSWRLEFTGGSLFLKLNSHLFTYPLIAACDQAAFAQTLLFDLKSRARDPRASVMFVFFTASFRAAVFS
jgi:hypothetical protein